MNRKLFSFAQEEILSVERFYEGTCANNIGGIISIIGEVIKNKWG